MFGKIIIWIERGITAFICFGLFSLVGDYVAKIVHLSTVEIEDLYQKCVSKINHNPED